MSELSSQDLGALPEAEALMVERQCNLFEAAWQSANSGGSRPRIEDYLGEASEPVREILLVELIALDIAYRRLRGEEPQPDDYLRRFPALSPARLAGAMAARPTSPLSTTCEGEKSAGEAVRCPHCHNPIRLSDGSTGEVLCPACGSTFHVHDSRPTSTTAQMQQLGKFQLLERVGLGAFGAVWKARDTELDRVVALKIPHAGLLATPAEQERFRREARAAAQLRHPNVVTVHEVATLNGLPALVSDFVAGVPLRDLLQVRRLTFRESAALAVELAEALDYAHRMGVVHRDVKPANVLLEHGRAGGAASGGGVGRPLLADFGLALREEAEVTMTVEGQVLGTPAYMSPEQASGKGHRVDGRSDVYSLGVVLYEMLTGELPFRGSKAMILHQVLHEEPRAPRRVNDKVPRDLETVCLKALAKEPARRFATARELAEDLRRFLAGEPIRARPVGRLERFWRWCRRKPAAAALVGVSAAAAVTLVAVVGTSAAIVYAKNQDLERMNDDLGRVNQDLKQTNRDLDDERNRVEATLARSLLRPLGHGIHDLNTVELEALWELAASRSDRLRLLFIEDALRRPETARQLSNRSALAVHAAVGLDRVRMQQVGDMLLARLKDREVAWSIRADCSLAGLALGTPTPAFAVEAARLLAEAMGKTDDLLALNALAEALSALAGRLEPAEATQVARLLVEAMGKTNDFNALASLSGALSALAGRLGSGEAARAARGVVEAMGKINNPRALYFLAEALSALADRLEPGEASRQTVRAARGVVEAMGKTNDHNALRSLAGALSALAGRLEPGEAMKVARLVAEAMGQTTNAIALAYLATALSALADRLEPGEASRQTVRAARLVVEAMGKTNDPDALYHLAGALSALAGRLEPAEAMKAARGVVEAMGKTTASIALNPLSGALTALVGRLEPAEAAQVARLLVEAMGKTTNAYALYHLAKALSALAGRLEPGEASRQTARAARLLAEAMGKTDDLLALNALAGALSALAGHLEPAEAARAARLVVEAMGKTTNPYALYHLAKALSALAGRLEPAEAAQVARLLVEAMGKTRYSLALEHLTGALSALAGRLEPAEAMKAARLLVEAMGKTFDTHRPDLLAPVDSMAGVLSALAVRLEPEEASNRAILFARAIGEGLSPPTRLSGLATLLQASRLPPCRFSPQELVELLKMPTCVGPAREAVLRLLGQTYDRRFADLWAFVDYAREHHPELDLTTPPQRPQK